MSLAHRRAGRGEPLLLVHGTGSQWQMWAPVLDRLARERDVVAVDLPGFGDSPPLADGRAPTPAALAEVVAGWARHTLGWESAHVAGNSLGGGIALELTRSGFARSACGLSPIGFWTAAEVAYARRSLALSRAVSLRLAPHAERAFGSPAGRVALLGQCRPPTPRARSGTSPPRRASTRRSTVGSPTAGRARSRPSPSRSPGARATRCCSRGRAGAPGGLCRARGT